MDQQAQARPVWRSPWLLLAGILLAHVACNTLWVRADQTMRGFDEPLHVTAACHAINLVLADGVAGAGQAARGRRAGQWPSAGYVPWVLPALVVGHDLPALRLFNSGYLALLLLALLFLGRRLHSDRAGVLAAALVTLYPAIFGASRHFNQDLPYVAVVAVCMALLLATERYARSGHALALGAAVGFSVLVRPHAAVILAAPGVLWTIWSVARPRAGCPRWRVLLNVALCGAVAAGVSAIWWAGRLDHIQEIYASHQQGTNMFSWMHKQSSLAYYLKGLPLAISAPLSLAFAGGCVGLALGLARAARGARRPRPEMLLIWIWLVLGLAAMASFRVHLNRYQYPLLPAVALLSACGLCSLPHRWLRRGAVAAALLAGVCGWLLCSSSHLRPGSRLVLDCDPNSSCDFGEPFESSGPPAEETLYTAGLKVARHLRQAHSGGRGVLVSISRELRVAMMLKPALMTTLPLLQLSHRELQAYGQNQPGEECEPMHQTLGGFSFPLPNKPFNHCYTLVDTFKADRGPPDAPPRSVPGATRVMEASTRWRDGVARFVLWRHQRCPVRAGTFFRADGEPVIPCD